MSPRYRSRLARLANNYERILARLATFRRMSALSSAIRARSKSMSIVGLRQPLFGAPLRALPPARRRSPRPSRRSAPGSSRVRLDFGEAERNRQIVLLLPRRYQSSPAPSSASSGVCPGSTPNSRRRRGSDLIDRLVDERPVGRDDLQLDVVGKATGCSSISSVARVRGSRTRREPAADADYAAWRCRNFSTTYCPFDQPDELKAALVKTVGTLPH